MGRPVLVLALIALAVAGGGYACSTWRWVGAPLGMEPRKPWAVSVSTGPARPRPAVDVPYAPSSRVQEASFAGDLGPEELDVSAYPAQQRHNYEVFKDACARCHTLARALNAPRAGRAWWRTYIFGMRLHAGLARRPLSAQEARTALEFLEYDESARKSAPEYEALVSELDQRFIEVVEKRLQERMERYQSGKQPRLLPSEP